MYEIGCDIDSLGDSSSYDDDTEVGTTVVLINGQRHVLPADGGTTVVNIPGMRNLQIGDGQINFISGQTCRSHHRKQSPTRSPKADSSGQRQRQQHPELSDSTLKPSRSDLNHVCNNIGKKWKKLGSELGLGRGQIEAIEIDYHVEGTYEMAYQTMLKWKRQNGDQVTIRDLVLALDSIGMSELARELPVK